jgi:4-hydroxy-3-methylbut-2-enyl diphosphate reductase
MGVRRAVDLARAEAERAAVRQAAGRVFTLGPLIHNPQALEELKSRGVEILDENRLPPDPGGASVIIRAHGLSPQAEARLRERGGRIIDATCPKVKASQLKAKALAGAGFRLFLAGEAEHAEIIGIRGYALAGSAGESFCAVVGSAAEAASAAAALRALEPASPSERTALIGQTTISEEEYRAIGEAVKKYFPDLEIVQTICAATKERQEALREMLDRIDAVIVAGGKESANTRRLFAIAAARGKPCALAENAAGIPPEFAGFQTVGLCAGASTPDAVIDEIEEALILSAEHREKPDFSA